MRVNQPPSVCHINCNLAIFVIFIGGAVSFRKLGQDYLTHYLDGVVEVIDQELADPQGSQAISRWLPKLLKASNVVEIEVGSSAGVVYAFEGLQPLADRSILHESRYELEHNPGFTVTMKSIPPYTEFTYSIGAMSSISRAIAIITSGWSGAWTGYGASCMALNCWSIAGVDLQWRGEETKWVTNRSGRQPPVWRSIK